MKWTRLTIKTTTTAEDIIISEMYDLGLMGAQIEDNVPLTAWEKEQMFVDILPENGPDDGRALLHFFVEVSDEPAEGAEATGFTSNGVSASEDNSYTYVSGENVVSDLPGLIDAMKEKLSEIASYMDIGDGTIEVSETEDTDWENNWKEFFHPFMIDDLLILPTWMDTEDAVKEIIPGDGSGQKQRMEQGTFSKVLRIDPGSAFGTGMHETTQLCIRAIRENAKNDDAVLDVGTGSGILGIASLLFGAGRVIGTDLDICAKDAVAENLAVNNIPESKFELIIGNVITDEALQKDIQASEPEGFDIVAANILAPVLVSLTPVAAKLIKQNGLYITSGILEGKEDSVQKACEDAGLKVIDIRSMGEWRCVIAKKA